MATVSTHILDSTNGSSAAGIRAQLFRLKSADERVAVFNVHTDNEGRIAETISKQDWDASDEYELVFHSGDYFSHIKQDDKEPSGKTVVLRFSMPEFGKRYHMPVMLSPNSYSVWWSS
ncbi:MAG: hydroxyisourate hydrolase [Pseudomonadota bacterium]